MPVLLRIAFRNLLEHKAKSLIIGSIVALGTLILIVGNSLMDTAARGIHDAFIANYTGDVFVSGLPKAPGSKVSVFGVQSTSGELEETPVMPEFDATLARLSGDRRAAAITSQVTGFGTLSVESGDKQSLVLLFGVDSSSYQKLFGNMFLYAGRWLREGEEGIVIPKGRLAEINKDLGATLEVGDKVLVNGFGISNLQMGGSSGMGAPTIGGIRIREATIVGVVDFASGAQGIDPMCYLNADMVRILSGMNVSAEDVVLSAEETALLSAKGEEDIFGGEESVVRASDAKRPAETMNRAAALQPQPGAESAANPSQPGGSWNFLLVRLTNPAQAAGYIRDANAWFVSQDISAQAGDWKVAAGPFAESIDVVRVVFDVAIIIVAVVAVIIIMNTLVISVIERTGEIGTMRALGAQKPFVWRMFLTETLTVTFVFGVIGIALAFALIGVVNALRITAGNQFVRVLFAGNELRMAVQPLSILMTVGLVAFVGLVAHLYPVSIAIRVPPVRAMQTE